MGLQQVLAEAMQEANSASGRGCPEGSKLRQVEESKREEEPSQHLRSTQHGLCSWKQQDMEVFPQLSFNNGSGTIQVFAQSSF